MASTATMTTMRKVLESLPEQVQERVVEHMLEYIEDIRDEAKWDESFARTQTRLVAAARQARKEIAEGKASPMVPKRPGTMRRCRQPRGNSIGSGSDSLAAVACGLSALTGRD